MGKELWALDDDDIKSANAALGSFYVLQCVAMTIFTVIAFMFREQLYKGPTPPSAQAKPNSRSRGSRTRGGSRERPPGPRGSRTRGSRTHGAGSLQRQQDEKEQVERLVEGGDYRKLSRNSLIRNATR